MDRQREKRNIPESMDNQAARRITSENWGDIPPESSFWDQYEDMSEELEEEEMLKELSYEIYEPPPPEERDIGQIIRDSYGFYRKMGDSADEIGVPHQVTEDVIYRYTLCNSNGMLVQVITFGATITAIRMPDNKNIITDVTLGLNDLEDYMSEKNDLCFGSLLGRFNSLISNGEIKLGKNEYVLSTNVEGAHHEKGGFYGFDKVVWQSYVAYDRVIMTHVSPHLEEGYPGDLMIQISFHLTKDNCLVVNTTANTSLPTILSVGHNLFFNLAGHESGPEGLKEHSLLVNADKYVKVDNQNMPTGELTHVGATYFDLRVPRPVWKAMARLPGGGYDHVFCLTKGYPRDSVSFACRLVHPPSGRYLEIMTDMPGLYVNTGTKLPDIEALPPLEAQIGFNEEVYPEFCREQKMKEKEIKELQNKMAARQTWPKQEVLPESVAIKLSIPPDVESVEKKVIFRGKSRSSSKNENIGKSFKEEESNKEDNAEKEGTNKTDKKEQRIDNKEETSREELNEEQKQKVESDEPVNKISSESETDEDRPSDTEIRPLKFLKDVAESDEEEGVVTRWLPPQPIIGRKGASYVLNGGICFMTQEYPDSTKHKEFPKPVLKPGEKYSRTTVYKFGIIPIRKDQSSTVYL